MKKIYMLLVILVIFCVQSAWAQNTAIRDYSCIDAGSTDAYACNFADATIPVVYEISRVYILKANTANTGASTVDFNSIGAPKAIKKWNGTALVDTVTGDICALQWVTLVYNGTAMELASPPCTPPTAGADHMRYTFGCDGGTSNATEYVLHGSNYSGVCATAQTFGGATNTHAVLPFGVTSITNLRCVVTAAPSSGNTFDFTIQSGTVRNTLSDVSGATCQITNGSTEAECTWTGSASLPAGARYIGIKNVKSLASVDANPQCAVEVY